MPRLATVGRVKLILVRHGQTPSNVAGHLDTGVPGAGLTALGRAQAAALPDALAGERVAGLHVSHLVRTQQTSHPLAAALGLEPVVHPGLAEISAGELEMRSEPEARTAYAECVAAWMTGDHGRTMPGGHDAHAFLERYDAAVADLASHHDPDETVVVVSHGAAIRAWTALRARDVTAESAVRLGIANTGCDAARPPHDGMGADRLVGDPARRRAPAPGVRARRDGRIRRRRQRPLSRPARRGRQPGTRSRMSSTTAEPS